MARKSRKDRLDLRPPKFKQRPQRVSGMPEEGLSQEEIKIYRQRYVSEMLSQDMGQVDIIKEMSDPESRYYCLNPKTDRCFGRTTIIADIKELRVDSQRRLRIRARQDMVMSLRARGYKPTEIHAHFSDTNKTSFVLDPDTGLPYTLATIEEDLEYIQTVSLEIIRDNIDTHRARQLMELQELRRAAYARGQLQVVSATLRDEMKLLGTPMPVRTIVDVNQTIVDQSAKDSLREKIGRLSVVETPKKDEHESATSDTAS